MNHASKYQIPDFQLHELIQAEYGHELTPAPNNSYYVPCELHNHSTPGRGGAMRVYAYPGAENTPPHGGFTCPRPSCGGSAWDYLKQVMGLPGPSSAGFDETLEYIADLLGKELKLKSGHEKTPADDARRLMRDIRDGLRPIGFNEANAHYQQGEDGRWLYRGIDPLTWIQYDVGMLPTEDRKQILSKYDDAAIRAAGISNWNGCGYEWLSGGVLTIRRSQYGTPLGLAVRIYPSMMPGVEAKYAKNNHQSEILDTREYLFGLDGLSDWPEVFVVEGEFDQLALRVRGMPNVITHGSGHPSAGQIQRMQELDKHLVFVADSDANEAGFEHISHIAEKLPQAEFVFLPGQDTDPDEFVQQQGVEAFRNLGRYTAMQVRMVAEETYSWNESRWTRSQNALASKYMSEIVNTPSVQDERNIEMISTLAQMDVEYLKSWLFYARNRQAVDQAPNKPIQWSR